MKMELSKTELKSLLELLSLAEFMYSVSYEELPEDVKKYDDLIKKILKTAQENGLGEYVEENEKSGIMFSDKLRKSEKIAKIINSYEDDCFWHLLVLRLAIRDVFEETSPEEYLELDAKTREKLMSRYEETYRKEFEENSIKNLKISDEG